MKYSLLLILTLSIISGCSQREDISGKNSPQSTNKLSSASTWASARSCPEWQTMTGIAGMEFCELAPKNWDEHHGSGSTQAQKWNVSKNTDLTTRKAYLRKMILDNTEITWGHDPIPSRHYTMKTYTALKQVVTSDDVPVLRALADDKDKFVKIWAENALRELTATGTTWK